MESMYMGEKIDREYGLLQGDMTSPFLFSEYLHKEYGAVLGDRLLVYLLFADDLVLCAESAQDLPIHFYIMETKLR